MSFRGVSSKQICLRTIAGEFAREAAVAELTRRKAEAEATDRPINARCAHKALLDLATVRPVATAAFTQPAKGGKRGKPTDAAKLVAALQAAGVDVAALAKALSQG